jgi:beta-lactamase superfamily II metal-dependent hydrolase
MIIPHHGSITTLADSFIEDLCSNIHICSCDRRQFDRRGTNNENNETDWFYTARDGAIELTIDTNRDIKARPLAKVKLTQRQSQ